MLKHAFESMSLAGLIYKIISDSHKEIPSSYSEDLSNLVCRLLTKSAEDRPSIKDLRSNIYVQAHIERLLPELHLPSLPMSSPKAEDVPARAQPPPPREEEISEALVP